MTEIVITNNNMCRQRVTANRVNAGFGKLSAVKQCLVNTKFLKEGDSVVIVGGEKSGVWKLVEGVLVHFSSSITKISGCEPTDLGKH